MIKCDSLSFPPPSYYNQKVLNFIHKGKKRNSRNLGIFEAGADIRQSGPLHLFVNESSLTPIDERPKWTVGRFAQRLTVTTHRETAPA
jgi:hypothetical protein